MFGTRFELDEEKILREGKYDLEAMYARIEEVATTRAKMAKVSKNHYEFRGKENAQAYLGILNFNFLSQCEWFTKNVKRWEWLNDEYGDGYTENLIPIAKEYNLGVWDD